MSRVTTQRVALVAIVVVVGGLSLPLTALLLDTVVDENLLLPIQWLASVLVCAGAGAVLREAVAQGASARRGALLGAILGLIAAGASDVVLLFLISG